MKKPKSNVIDLFPDISKDPLNFRARVYRQYGRLLDLMEDTEAGDDDGMTIPQLINALKALNEYDLKTVRGTASGSTDTPAGSAVRKYAAAFKDAGSRRKTGGGPAAVTTSAETDADDAGDDDDDA